MSDEKAKDVTGETHAVEETALEKGAFVLYEASGDVSGLLGLADWCEEQCDPPRTRFAKLLRAVGGLPGGAAAAAAAVNPAVHWFYKRAAFGYQPDRETVGEGKLRGAATLAWHEAIAARAVAEGLWRYVWEVDDLGTQERNDEMDRERNYVLAPGVDDVTDLPPLWSCSLMGRLNQLPSDSADRYATGGERYGWHTLESLGGIDLRDDQPPGNSWTGGLVAEYAREVQADLAGAAYLRGAASGRELELPPDWLGYADDVKPTTVEVCIFRVSTIPELRGALFALLPEVPAPDSVWPHAPEYHSGRCAIVDGLSRPEIGSTDYEYMMRHSRSPSDDFLRQEFLAEAALRAAIRSHGIEPCVKRQADRGYRLRREARRRTLIALSGKTQET